MTKFNIQTIYKNPKWTGQTAIGLEHLQSFIDLRRRRRLSSITRNKCEIKGDARLIINVSGCRFETWKSTVERYPNTLLGNARRRTFYYDKTLDEYFFDRHRPCFEAILYFYQSRGRLRRPENVALDTFLEEITFFDLGPDALAQVRQAENLQEAHPVHLPKNRFCRHLWANLEYPEYSWTARIINIVSMIFILLSALELAVETLPKYRRAHNNRCEQEGDGLLVSINSTLLHQLCPTIFTSPFFIIQTVCISFFTIEFILRLVTCPSYLDFIKSILNWIDLLAIVPFYITLLISLLNVGHAIDMSAYIGISLLRVLRFIRVFKLYRIFKRVKSLRVLGSTLKESLPDFAILLTFLTLSGFLFGAAIYFAEKDANGIIFDSIPKAIYFGIITLTAVGYGDMTPVTAIGRALACFAAIYGISVVSMLVSVLVGRYQRVYTRKLFLNETLSDDLVFNDTFTRLHNHEQDQENGPIGSLFTLDNVLEENQEHEQEDEPVEEHASQVPSGKVRFIIGYVSDDSDDDDDGQKETSDASVVAKVAQELLQSKPGKNSCSIKRENIRM